MGCNTVSSPVAGEPGGSPSRPIRHSTSIATGRDAGDGVASELGSPSWLFVERKGPSVAFHVRQADDVAAARAAVVVGHRGRGAPARARPRSRSLSRPLGRRPSARGPRAASARRSSGSSRASTGRSSPRRRAERHRRVRGGLAARSGHRPGRPDVAVHGVAARRRRSCSPLPISAGGRARRGPLPRGPRAPARWRRLPRVGASRWSRPRRPTTSSSGVGTSPKQDRQRRRRGQAAPQQGAVAQRRRVAFRSRMYM